jgi:hypothetical protein
MGFPHLGKWFLAVDIFPYMSGLLRKIFSELLSETSQGLCVCFVRACVPNNSEQTKLFSEFLFDFPPFFYERACMLSGAAILGIVFHEILIILKRWGRCVTPASAKSERRSRQRAGRIATGFAVSVYGCTPLTGA